MKGLVVTIGALLLAASCEAGVIHLEVTAPTKNYVGPGCPDLEPDDDTEWEYRVGTPLTDLKEILIRAVRFDAPGDTIVAGRIHAVGREGEVLQFDFEGEDGIHGALLASAVDLSGNESCGGAQLVFVIPAVDAPPAVPGLAAEYFDDVALSVPFGQRVDPNIDFDWNSAAPMPGMGVETFSARWTGMVTVGAPGTYRFRGRVEDAVRLWVDGTLVLDSWIVELERDVIGSIPLAVGTRPFRLEYFANFGQAAMRLYWTPPGGVEAIVPASAFSH